MVLIIVAADLSAKVVKQNNRVLDFNYDHNYMVIVLKDNFPVAFHGTKCMQNIYHAKVIMACCRVYSMSTS